MKTNNKEIILLVLFIFSGWIFWVLLYQFFLSPEAYSPRIYVPAIAFLLFAVLYGLSITLVGERNVWLFGWFLISAGSMFMAPSSVQSIWAVLLFLGGYFSSLRVKTALLSSIGKTFYLAIRKGFPWMLTALSLLIAATFIGVRPEKTASVETLFPEEFFVGLLRKSDNIIAKRIPEFNTDISFSEYVMNIAESESHIDITKLSQNEKVQLVLEAEKQIENRFDIDIDTEKTLGELLYIGGTAKFSERIGRISAGSSVNYLPYLTVIGIFIVLRTFFFPIGILVLFMIVIIIRLLLHYNIAKLENIEYTVQYPTLSS